MEVAATREETAPERAPDTTSCPVSSHNEWDPLEEVIVGRLEGATIPSNHISVSCDVPAGLARLYGLVGGMHYPRVLTEPAKRELAEFIRILEGEGVTVRQPDVLDWKVRARTPHWQSTGFCISCPRDGFLVVGDEIIETPMAWRSRFFEAYAYRSLFKEYFRKGARWSAAPRPELTDELYDHDYRVPEPGEPIRYVITEFEPVFDAADFVRCGRDLFVTPSNVTNQLGIEWLRRHLGDGYRVHTIESSCPNPMHIDSTLLPLAPGKLLVNPEWIDPARLPAAFRSWDVLEAPKYDPAPWWDWRSRMSMCSGWISINVLMLDPERVIVEQHQESLIRKFRDWGFKPIPCSFLNFAPFGGSFHCATLDVRRRGTLESYC